MRTPAEHALMGGPERLASHAAMVDGGAAAAWAALGVECARSGKPASRGEREPCEQRPHHLMRLGCGAREA